MTLDPAQVAALASIIGAVVVAGIKKVWVFGYYAEKLDKDLSDMTSDRNFWRDAALRSMGNVDKTTSIAEKTVGG